MNRSLLIAALCSSRRPRCRRSPGRTATTHAHFSAGEPGDPKRSARVVDVIMKESDGKMDYVPDRIEVVSGEQIRFVLQNAGELAHEFVLATTAENLKHAAVMQKYPDMEHDDPNGKRLQPKGRSEILWRFTKAGEFEYRLPDPGPPRGRHDRQGHRQIAQPSAGGMYMRKITLSAIGAAALAMAALPGCGAGAVRAGSTAQVTKVDASAGKITIRHGPLKKFDMDEGMTMVFRAGDPAMLKAVKAGDKVKFVPDRINGQFTVMKIQKAK